MEKITKKYNRVRHFFLVLYCSTLELIKILMKYNVRIAHAVYIVHDKCVYQDDLLDDDGNYIHRKGEKEKVHIHLLISFYNTHTFSAVKKLFTTENDNPRVEPVNDMIKCYEYLTHVNDIDKYQYSTEELIFFHDTDEQFYKDLLKEGEKRESDNIAVAIVKDLLRGTKPMIMLNRYGTHFLLNMQKYKDFIDEIHSWDINHPTQENGDKWCEELEQMGLFDE